MISNYWQWLWLTCQHKLRTKKNPCALGDLFYCVEWLIIFIIAKCKTIMRHLHVMQYHWPWKHNKLRVYALANLFWPPRHIFNACKILRKMFKCKCKARPWLIYHSSVQSKYNYRSVSVDCWAITEISIFIFRNILGCN